MNIKEIKNQGKLAFKANYWKCVLVAFILSLLTVGTTASSGTSSKTSTKEAQDKFAESFNAMSASDQKEFVAIIFGALTVVFIVSFLLKIFLFNPLQVGGYRFFKNNLSDSNTSVGVVAEGFGGYFHTWATLFLRDLFWSLWACLLLIPGIIKYYSYLMVPYIIKDNPELSATEAITRSREMMNGHKMEAFLMDLSFIGWYILGAITLDLVNIFWTEPYHQSSRAKFYTELM